MDSRLAWRLFRPVLRPWMGSRLRVHMTGLGDGGPSSRRVLLCANHESFWDGFLLQALQGRCFPGHSFHAVMLRSELERRPWLAHLGAIPADPGSVAGGRRMLRAIQVLRAGGSAAVLAYFPQGRIRPGDPRPLEFRPGVDAVARTLAPVTVLPVGIRLFPGRAARMDAFLSVGEALEVPVGGEVGTDRLEAAVGEELDAVRAHVAEHGEDAVDRWPGAAGRLLRAKDPSWISHGVERWISRN